MKWIRENTNSLRNRHACACDSDMFVEWTETGRVRIVNPVTGDKLEITTRRQLLQLADQLAVANEQIGGFDYSRFQERYE